jgi:hypothetical protein
MLIETPFGSLVVTGAMIFVGLLVLRWIYNHFTQNQ